MVRIQPGIEFPIIPEDLIVMEEPHPYEVRPSGERKSPDYLKDTENNPRSHKSKLKGQHRFRYERVRQ
jgi:hypothetical protein